MHVRPTTVATWKAYYQPYSVLMPPQNSHRPSLPICLAPDAIDESLTLAFVTFKTLYTSVPFPEALNGGQVGSPKGRREGTVFGSGGEERMSEMTAPM